MKLPRYVIAKRLASGSMAYFFNPPKWARAKGCTVAPQPLGTDYDAMRERAERILLPAFDSWLSGGEDRKPGVGVVKGTLDWLFHEWRPTWSAGTMKRKGAMSAGQRRNNETGIKLLCEYKLTDGSRVGDMPIDKITKPFLTKLYQLLLVKTDKDGQKIERRTTVNHAFRTGRAAWNTIAGLMVMPPNPFMQLGLRDDHKERAWATFEELKAFRAAAIDAGYPSIATGALIGWELLQRKEHIFTRLMAEHYRPAHQPRHIYVENWKTKTGAWEPLFDAKGKPLYPALMAELDAIKAKRPTGGLLLRRDVDGRPWAGNSGLLTQLERTVRKIIEDAGLRPELSFTSFGRHGGATESQNSGLTELELKHKGQWSSVKAMVRYTHGNDEVRANAQEKRLKARARKGAK